MTLACRGYSWNEGSGFGSASGFLIAISVFKSTSSFLASSMSFWIRLLANCLMYLSQTECLLLCLAILTISSIISGAGVLPCFSAYKSVVNLFRIKHLPSAVEVLTSMSKSMAMKALSLCKPIWLISSRCFGFTSFKYSIKSL